MPLRNYGVLAGRVLGTRAEGGTGAPALPDPGPRRRRRVPGGRQRPVAAVAVRAALPRGRGLRPPGPTAAGRPAGRVLAAAGASRRAGVRLHPREPLRPGGDAPAAARRRRAPTTTSPTSSTTTSSGRSADPAARLYAFGERWGPETGHGGQDLRLPPRQRRPRHPHEPGQHRPVRAGRRRLAGRRAAPALPRHAAVGRRLPRLPEPGLAHRRPHRPHAARTCRPSASSPGRGSRTTSSGSSRPW